MLMLEISIDQELKVGYVKSSASTFSRTITIKNEINIDLDVDEKVIGVEFLGFSCLNQSEESLSEEAPSLKQEYNLEDIKLIYNGIIIILLGKILKDV